MKIYNLGSDYAHQQSLKRREGKPEPVESVQFQSETSAANAADQIQGGGEGEMASSTTTQDSPKKTKKKKEDGAEKE